MGIAIVGLEHRLPGRIRISLSIPPTNINEFNQKIKRHIGINSVNYTTITNSVLIYYNPVLVEEAEIILRVATTLSVQHNLIPIDIKAKPKRTGLTEVEKLNIMVIGVTCILTNSGINKGYLKTINNITAGFTTYTALNHAKNEVIQNGGYDPEVISLVYLLNAWSNGKPLLASVVTWIATFIRHLALDAYNDCSLKVYKVIGEGEKTYYDVEISPKKIKESLLFDFKFMLNQLAKLVGVNISESDDLIKQFRNVALKHGNVLEGLIKNNTQIYLRLE